MFFHAPIVLKVIARVNSRRERRKNGLATLSSSEDDTHCIPAASEMVEPRSIAAYVMNMQPSSENQRP
jgi:hypothetical protein